ncbi:hypothetical protein FRC11_012457 [Ceratobasidium sp. 423]|nr:hypothetical protein FRC11_012457 [Ceratobasidium sp. 423]
MQHYLRLASTLLAHDIFHGDLLRYKTGSTTTMIIWAMDTLSLAHFVAYALHRTCLHSLVTFCALYLLSHLKNRFPAARGSLDHHLYISAFMIAFKVICDDTYSNKSWCVVSQGMFTLHDFELMVHKEYDSAPATPTPDCSQ